MTILLLSFAIFFTIIKVVVDGSWESISSIIKSFSSYVIFMYTLAIYFFITLNSLQDFWSRLLDNNIGSFSYSDIALLSIFVLGAGGITTIIMNFKNTLVYQINRALGLNKPVTGGSNNHMFYAKNINGRGVSSAGAVL